MILGQTPLLWVADGLSRLIEGPPNGIVKSLIEHVIEIYCGNCNGRTELLYAVTAGPWDTATLPIGIGAAVCS